MVTLIHLKKALVAMQAASRLHLVENSTNSISSLFIGRFRNL